MMTETKRISTIFIYIVAMTITGEVSVIVNNKKMYLLTYVMYS